MHKYNELLHKICINCFIYMHVAVECVGMHIAYIQIHSNCGQRYVQYIYWFSLVSCVRNWVQIVKEFILKIEIITQMTIEMQIATKKEKEKVLSQYTRWKGWGCQRTFFDRVGVDEIKKNREFGRVQSIFTNKRFRCVEIYPNKFNNFFRHTHDKRMNLMQTSSITSSYRLNVRSWTLRCAATAKPTTDNDTSVSSLTLLQHSFILRSPSVKYFDSNQRYLKLMSTSA